MGKRDDLLKPILEDDEYLASSSSRMGCFNGFIRGGRNGVADLEPTPLYELTKVDAAKIIAVAIFAWEGGKYILRRVVPWVKQKWQNRHSHKGKPYGLEVVYDEAEIIEQFESEYNESDPNDIKTQQLLLEYYFCLLKAAVIKIKLTEKGVEDNNNKLISLVEDEEICNRMNDFLVDNGDMFDEDLWNVYHTLFDAYLIAGESVYINQLYVGQLLAG